jgi:UDP:flavonoid glycosyltransferase YjiC (YdhE family)
MTRILGVRLSQVLFDITRPLAFGLHCIPMNSVRRHFGLESLGHDLRRIYTDADEVLLADLPEYFPITAEAKNHRYLGPISWSPRFRKPSWWDEINTSRPVVYVTLGSSGRVDLLSTVLEALASLPVSVIAATAGRTELASVPENALISDYIPGDEAAGLASLVVSNGGSLTTYQAIQKGTPVLGIPGNLDQHLNMSYLVAAGIGEAVRSENAGIEPIRQAVKRLLENPDYQRATGKAQDVLLNYSPGALFPLVLQEMLGRTRTA